MFAETRRQPILVDLVLDLTNHPVGQAQMIMSQGVSRIRSEKSTVQKYRGWIVFEFEGDIRRKIAGPYGIRIRNSDGGG
jgi:hypothetical protein